MAIVFSDIVGVAPNEIPGVTEPLARRVLATARTIAPCLNSLTGEARSDAIAILQGVAAEVAATGLRRVKSQSRNGTSITYADMDSAFDGDARAGLRALCTQSSTVGIPLSSFPQPSDLITNMWPETNT